MKTIPAYRGNFYAGRLARPRVIVIHSGETPESAVSAEGMANWFADPRARASAHVCADTDGLVRSVADSDTAWAAPGSNADGLQLELAGRASQTTAQWDDEASTKILRNGAAQVAAWHRGFDIPLRVLSDAELAGGRVRGITTHAQVSRVFRRSDHTDPGRFFPLEEFLRRAGKAPSPSPQPTDGGTTPVTPGQVPKFLYAVKLGNRGVMVKAVQRRMRSRGWSISVDAEFGPRTDAVIRKFQGQLGLPVTGVVDRQTWRAMWVAPITST